MALPERRREGDGGAWCVYLVRCADGTLYCGATADLARRLAMHNGELPGGARYTRARRPVVPEAWVCGLSRSAALRLEAMVKKQPRTKKAAFLLAATPFAGDGGM